MCNMCRLGSCWNVNIWPVLVCVPYLLSDIGELKGLQKTLTTHLALCVESIVAKPEDWF